MTSLYRPLAPTPAGFAPDHLPPLPSDRAYGDWLALLAQVREARLDNGLTVLALPRKGSGAVVCDLYYAGGSAVDPPGKTGLTHFLEHMLFNGTRAVPKGALDRLMLRLAGQHNAETGSDFCRFWSHVPGGALELVLALEADRMRNALLDPGDFLRERQVILEEEARYRELPFEDLMTRLMANIFEGHPYAHPAIGSTADLHSIEIDDLRNQYRRVFRPSNGLLVIAGDVTVRQAHAIAAKRFSKIENGPDDPLPDIPVPATTAFDGRKISLESTEIVPRGAMIWPAPGPFDLASRAWGIAAAVLGSGRASRLWKAIVEEQQIAAHVGVSLSEERQGGYLLVELELHPDQNPQNAESVIFETIQKLVVEGPTAEEMARVTASRASAGCWARQQTLSLAASIGTWRLFADLDALADAWRRDDLVTPADVARVAATLIPERCVRGWSMPAAKHRGAYSGSVSPPVESVLPRTVSTSVPPDSIARVIEKLAARSARRDVKIGRKPQPRLHRSETRAILLAEPAHRQGISALELRWRYGSLEEAVPGLAFLTARILEETPAAPGDITIAEKLESIGASIDSGPSGIAIQGRAEDLNTIVEILSNCISNVSPSASLMKRTARKVRTELEADSDDPAFLAERMLREIAFDSLPGATDPRGTPDSLKKIKLADVKRHAELWYRPANMILGIAGEFRAADALRKMDRTIRMTFSRKSIGQRFDAPTVSPEIFDRPLPKGRIRIMRSPGTQTHVVLGHRTIARTHPDWIALQVLEMVIGAGPGLTDLLSRRLREELGLIYGVNMAMTESAWTTPGLMRISFSCDPDDALQAEAETLKILSEAAAGRFSDEDCLQARDHLANSWFLSYESADDRLSSRLDAELEDWDLGLPPRWARLCAALSADEIRKAARRHIQPEFIQIVRYGP